MPVALIQQITVVFVPLSPLVMAPTRFFPLLAKIFAGFATVEMSVSSTLKILAGGKAEYGSKLSKNNFIAVSLNALALFIDVPSGRRIDISG